MKKIIRKAAMALSALFCFATTGAYADGTVTLNDGGVDTANWTAKAGEGDYQALPLEGVTAGTTVTVKYDGDKVVQSVKAVKLNPLAVPLTVEAITAGTVKVNMSATLGTGMKYSKNGGDKTTIYSTTDIVVAAGDKVQFYGNGTETQVYGDYPEVSIRGSGEGFTCKVYGNIMSLVDETGFATNKTLTAENTFAYLFYGNTTLTDASGLLLPAKTLTSYCYSGMFEGCIALTTAPELPAETLAQSCYLGMFDGCSALTTAPALPAETLAESCYLGMFAGCSALTTAPELKATTLADGCYAYMFYDCSNLASVTCLATDITAEDCTYYWLQGVAASGTFTKAAGVDWSGKTGYNGIPSGWTVKEYVDPKLAVPLTIEAITSGTIKVNIGSEGDDELTTGMKYSKNGGDKTTIYETTDIAVAAGDKVQFYGNGTATQVYGGDPEVSIQGDGEGFTWKVYGNIMSLLDEENFATKTDLPNEGWVFYGLFSDNDNLTDASGLLLPAQTLASNCYNCMFYGCSSLSAAPELPAETLVYGCYAHMFNGCSSLNSVTCLATDIGADYCTQEWLNGVAASGTFTKASGVDWSGKGIPTWNGWTVEEAAAAEPEPAPADIELTPTENANEWTFAMPEFDVELQVAYYTEDELAALAVDALIEAIGEVAYTADSKALIDAAREAYDALTDAQKDLVTNCETLTAAEATYADLEAAAVIDAIDAIGEVAYTAECKAKIDAARTAYDALTDDQKELVTNYETLTAAEAAYAALAAAAEFDAYKTEQIAVVEALAQDGDSEDATALIAAAKADIEALAFDSAKTLDENKAAVDAIVAKLIEDLAACRSVIVDVIIDDATQTDIEVTPGQPYTDEVIAAITEAAQSTATRHGQVVTGWKNVDGSEVTGQTVAKAGDKLTAVWDTVNPLVPETHGEGAVDNSKSVTYDAYVLDADGNAYGTVKVTVGKVNRKTGLSLVKAVVKPNTGKTITFKATEARGGKATVYSDEASVVELANKSNLMTLVIGKEGVEGYCSIGDADYEINGSRNSVKTDKASYDFWKGARAAVFVDETGAIVATFSFNVNARGRVTVKGLFAKDKKTTAIAQLMVSDDGNEACFTAKGSKKLPFSAVVWLGKDGAVTVESITTRVANGVECAAADSAGGLSAGAYTFQADNLTIPITFNGKKFTSTDARVSYKALTGEFSGSFRERYTNARGRMATRRVYFGGVFVDGVGYGKTKSGETLTITPDVE